MADVLNVYAGGSQDGNGTWTTGVVPAGVANYYDRKLLVRAKPKLLALQFGQKRPLPANSSDVIKFRRYSALGAATSALSEGTNPAGSQLTVTDITAQVAQYGDFVRITDRVQLLVEDNVLNEAADILADQMAETIDTLAFTTLKAGTNVFYSGTATQRSELASADISTALDKAIRLMRRNNAMEFNEMIKASTGVGTYPIRSAYWGIVHPDVVRDLESLDGFISVERYANSTPTHEDEIGAYRNIRFLMTTMAPYYENAGNVSASTTWVPCELAGATSKARIYQTLILAKESYGIVDLDRGNVKSIIKTPGPQSTNDPLNLVSSMGWKCWFAAKILNQSWICRVESLATA